MAFRFHCLGIPHTVTSKEYLPCAFTQKVLKFCQMMVNLGHEVIHYGNEASEVVCSEHVTVTTLADLDKTYGDRNYWKKTGFDHSRENHVAKEFDKNAIRELASRVQPNDFVLLFWGVGHSKIAEIVDPSKVFLVEPGIGYPHVFAPYRVYESYAKMHLTRGMHHAKEIEAYTKVNWNYEVIPNYFDPDDFEYSTEKEDYLFFIGRLMYNKGIEIAMRLADYFDIPLKLASQTDPKEFKNIMGWDPYHCIEFVGMVDIEQRKKLMSRAKAGVCASLYIEPFCGTHIEFGFSGTPVLTTDFGVFSETVLQGENGWRCMSFEEFVYAFENIDVVKPERCRELAMQYSLDRVSLMYHHYFDRIYKERNSINFWDLSSDRISNMDMKKEILSESEVAEQILDIQKKNGLEEKNTQVIVAAEKRTTSIQTSKKDFDVIKESSVIANKQKVNPRYHISSMKHLVKIDNMIFHVLASPHTVTSKEYIICAITQKALKFCQMMTDRGHHIIHYGNEASEVMCKEHVTVMTLEDLDKTYGDRNYWRKTHLNVKLDSHCYKVYHERIVPALLKQMTVRPNDHHFLLLFRTDLQAALIENLQRQLPDNIKLYIVEPSIPYESYLGHYRVFQSHAHEHYMRGQEFTVKTIQEDKRYGFGKSLSLYDDTFFRSTVIPNYFDPDDFEYSTEKEDYLCCVNRIFKPKGLEIAMRLANHVGLPLKLAGNGDRDLFKKEYGFEPYDCVEFVGFADLETRKKLMAHAKVGICASTWIETFTNTAVEFGFSGTPILAMDLGGLTDHIVNGVNGWRCRSFDDYVRAYHNIDKIKPQDCRDLAMRFTFDAIAPLYEDFFHRIIRYENSIFWDTYSVNFR